MRIESILAPNMAFGMPIQKLLRVSQQAAKEAHGKVPPAMRLLGWQGIDLHEVLKVLELNKQDNKVLLLMLLQRGDWIAILHLLEKEQLLWGLRFFSKEQLLRLIMRLPKTLLIKMLLHIFSIEDLVKRMPTRELLRILHSSKIQVPELVKAFASMDPKFLRFIMSKITGRRVDHLSQDQLLRLMGHLKKHQIMVALEKLPFKALAPLVTFFVKKDPELLERLSLQFFYDQFDKMTKPVLIDTMQVLPDEILIKFLSQLPDKLLVLVAAQVDNKMLEQYLLSFHPGLLSALGDLMTAA